MNRDRIMRKKKLLTELARAGEERRERERERERYRGNIVCLISYITSRELDRRINRTFKTKRAIDAYVEVI
jgi:hypothetical protein